MKKFYTKVDKYVRKHKIISAILALLVFGAIYLVISHSSADGTLVRYVTAHVEKGAIISSISGSGQVSASDQVDVKSKVSGDVTWVGVQTGQEILVGQALVSIDDTEARKSVANAEIDLNEAQLKLEKDIAQAPIDYDRELESLQKANDNLDKAYEDTFNAVSNSFLDLPAVITGVQDILFGDDLGYAGQWNIDVYRRLFQDEGPYLMEILAGIAEVDYKTARIAYDDNFLDFKNITRYSGHSQIEELLQKTINTTKAIAQAAKSETNLLDTIIDIANGRNVSLNSSITSFQSDLRGYLGIVNSNLSSLLSQQRSLEDSKNNITDIERDLSLWKINNPTGVNPLDLQIEKNSVKRKESELADLKSALADYVIRAPFDGVVAEIDVKKGEALSANSVVATLITHQKIAEIALNEIDIVKVKVGQKATVAFDAAEDLSITGEVIKVDSLATVSQGVVTYNATVAFDTQDVRIKPGMSVSVSIITEAKADVLTVPNSAIQYQGTNSFVQIMGAAGVLENRQVEVGLSNDTQTEILSGLNEGDEIITQTIDSTGVQSAATQVGSGILPSGGFGDSNVRFTR